ncbi:class I SAM-dependent methyltransferase [Mangrovicoccus ximenensis]|uniref:class I SAM-dependent methyltransferase n=1 Tax=Mangrovicoccus ximenensis TaxID=1911570 RepID=UPI001374FD1B|nr:methyltransferase domain-containing protein [Mangrovicoccus ximenensis]
MAGFTEFGARDHDGRSDRDIVDAYLRHFAPITDRDGRDIVAERVATGDDVLDLCCGQGTLAAEAAAFGANAAGLDFSPQIAARARAAAPGAEIVEGDAAAMPFGDAQFDKVLCNFGMMHIADQPGALAEIRRVLRCGGTFAMAAWMDPAASPAFAAVFGALRANADFSAAPAQPDLFAFADPVQARDLLAGAGLVMQNHCATGAAWTPDRPAELFDIFLTATVGAGMPIRSQSAETVGRMAAAIERTVSGTHADGTRYAVPVSVAVISALAA